MKPKTLPLTPAQALNNFRLLLELSPKNSYADYRATVKEIALIVLEHGILDVNAELLAASKSALAWFEREADATQRAGGDEPDGEQLDEYSSDSDEGENKMDVAALRAAINQAEGRTALRGVS